MKTPIASACMLALSVVCGPAWAQGTAAATAPRAAPNPPASLDWSVTVVTADVARGADQVWPHISGPCDQPNFLGVKSCSVIGNGDIGTVRLINGSLQEMLVSRTAHSVVFAQVPAPSFYHATLEVVPVDAGHSRIVCTLLSQKDPAIAPDAAAASAAQRQARFQAAVDKMKAAAETP